MPFLVINKNLRFNNLKTRTAMNARISVFVIRMRKLRCLLFVLMRSDTFCYITCITLPLTNFMPLVFFYLMFSEVFTRYRKESVAWTELKSYNSRQTIFHRRQLRYFVSTFFIVALTFIFFSFWYDWNM